MAFSSTNGQKRGILPEIRIGLFHHFWMVENDLAKQQGKRSQSHHYAMIVVGAETQGATAQFRQLGLHCFHPIRLF